MMATVAIQPVTLKVAKPLVDLGDYGNISVESAIIDVGGDSDWGIWNYWQGSIFGEALNYSAEAGSSNQSVSGTGTRTLTCRYSPGVKTADTVYLYVHVDVDGMLTASITGDNEANKKVCATDATATVKLFGKATDFHASVHVKGSTVKYKNTITTEGLEAEYQPK
jgi:hypothetical protein